MSKVKKMVYLALLIAVEIVFTRFLSIQTPIIRVGFGFIPIAIMGMVLGPVLAGCGAAIADLIGVFLFPSGAFFPGFTLSAFVGGAIYGLVFYKKKTSIKRVLLATTIIALFVNLLMNTYWLSIITGKAAYVLMVSRIVKEAIMFPIQISLIYTVLRYSEKFLCEVKMPAIADKN